MTDKISRNAACPCGSGKKYKRCCLSKSASNEVIDFAWHKFCQTEESVLDNHLLHYVMQQLPEEVMGTAMEDFLMVACLKQVPEKIAMELLFIDFFISWLLFSWIPYDDFCLELFDPEQSLALNYLKEHGDKLNSVEKQFIETMAKTYYSFYSVLKAGFSGSLVVKDILLGTIHKLKGQQEAHQLKRGDVVFSRILTLNGQSIFTGSNSSGPIKNC